MYLSHRKNVRDLSAKIVILGEPAVGKTSIRKRFMGEGFKSSYMPTIGADFAINKINYGDLVLHANIWDLAGQEYYDKIIRQYLRDTDAAVIIFDLTRPKTFKRLSYWFGKLKEAKLWPHKKFPIVILGNKSDLENHEVSESDVRMFIQNQVLGLESPELKIEFFKTSAKNGMNVPLAFELIAKQIIEYIQMRR